MSTHSIQFHDKIKKNPKMLVFWKKTSEEFCRNSKNELELSMVNEPLMFELLRFDCTFIRISSLALADSV